MSQHKKRNIDETTTCSMNIGDDVETTFTQMVIEDSETKMENESKYWEIKKVLGHRVDERGNWQFKIQFKDNSIHWIDDSDCDCEKSINDYLRLTRMARTIYCFCRVSTKKQTGVRHVSLETQEQCIHHAIKNLYGDNPGRVKVVKLNASAYRGIPTALSRIGEAARPGDVIFIYRIDRLSRNIFDYLAFLEDLNTRGVQIYAVDEGIWYHERRLTFMQGILDANKESEIIGKRVKDSINYLKSVGRNYSGVTSYGWSMVKDQNNNLIRVENPTEQKIIERIKKWAADVYVIANTLNLEGVLKRGKRWTPSMVLYVLKHN
jgi:DNA invertase Pin-like site-specific DNA recombinase